MDSRVALAHVRGNAASCAQTCRLPVCEIDMELRQLHCNKTKQACVVALRHDFSLVLDPCMCFEKV